MVAVEDANERIRRELPHLTVHQATDLAHTVNRLVDALQPERIYVFGSQARGDVHVDSDVDLLVVVSQVTEAAHRLDQAAYRAVGRHLLPLNILVMSREEFERRARAPASLPSTVLREGRVLYAGTA